MHCARHNISLCDIDQTILIDQRLINHAAIHRMFFTQNQTMFAYLP